MKHRHKIRRQNFFGSWQYQCGCGTYFLKEHYLKQLIDDFRREFGYIESFLKTNDFIYQAEINGYADEAMKLIEEIETVNNDKTSWRASSGNYSA